MSSEQTPTAPDGLPALARYLDIVLVVAAAPIMLLIGVAGAGYAIGGGTWIAVRAVGVGVERYASASSDASRQIAIRLGYLLGRLFVLAFAVILARQISRSDGLAALFVIVGAYTIGLAISFATRPKRASR